MLHSGKCDCKSAVLYVQVRSALATFCTCRVQNQSTGLQLQARPCLFTRTATCHAAQLGDIYVGVEVGMRDKQVCGKAQRAAHAAQCCNVVQGLSTLPDILLYMLYDAAEHICWQIGDRHDRLVRHCATVVMVLRCQLDSEVHSVSAQARSG